MPERIQKFLANQGYGSRRELERWIDEGRIKVNGKPAQLGQQVTGKERFEIDNRFVKTDDSPQATRVLMYHKPLGEVVSKHDPEGRPTVFQKLPKLRNGRWIAVGRLDINTSGLLLFTNNGELAKRLMHPSYEVRRSYAVRVFGDITEEQMKTLKTGVELEDGKASFDRLVPMRGHREKDESEDETYQHNRWYDCELHEGRNREVRRLWEAVDATVSRLIRTRYGIIKLPKQLSRGMFQDLNHGVLNQLLQSVDMKPEQKQQWHENPERKIERPTRPGKRTVSKHR